MTNYIVSTMTHAELMSINTKAEGIVFHNDPCFSASGLPLTSTTSSLKNSLRLFFRSPPAIVPSMLYAVDIFTKPFVEITATAREQLGHLTAYSG